MSDLGYLMARLPRLYPDCAHRPLAVYEFLGLIPDQQHRSWCAAVLDWLRIANQEARSLQLPLPYPDAGELPPGPDGSVNPWRIYTAGIAEIRLAPRQAPAVYEMVRFPVDMNGRLIELLGEITEIDGDTAVVQLYEGAEALTVGVSPCLPVNRPSARLRPACPASACPVWAHPWTACPDNTYPAANTSPPWLACAPASRPVRQSVTACLRVP